MEFSWNAIDGNNNTKHVYLNLCKVVSALNSVSCSKEDYTSSECQRLCELGTSWVDGLS